MAKNNNEPEYILSSINTPLLNYKYYKMKKSEKLTYFLGLLVIGGMIGFLFYGGLFKNEEGATTLTKLSNAIVFMGGGLIANKIFMPVLQDRLRSKRLSKLKIQFRDFLAALSTSMSSGMNVNDSLIAAYGDLCEQYSKDSYIAMETKEMIDGIQNNVPIEDTIYSLGERSGVEDISNFATVFSVCYRTGGNLKEVIKRSSDLISEKMIITEEINTKITSNKMQLNVMMMVPIVMMVLMKMMSFKFAESFASPVGIVAITIALGIFIGAYKMGRSIMDIRG